MTKEPTKEAKPAPVSAAKKFAAFIDGLALNQTITADVAAIIKAQIEAHKAKLDA